MKQPGTLCDFHDPNSDDFIDNFYDPNSDEDTHSLLGDYEEDDTHSLLGDYEEDEEANKVAAEVAAVSAEVSRIVICEVESADVTQQVRRAMESNYPTLDLTRGPEGNGTYFPYDEI